MTTASAADELVATIVDHLKSKTYSPSQVQKAVRYQISITQEAAGGTLFGWQAENKDYAKDVSSLAHELQQKLEGSPDGTSRSLFLFALYRQTVPHPDDVDYVAVELYRMAFLSKLKELQAGCALISAENIGDYHRVDVPKRLCAGAACSLMIGLDAGKPTNGDPFRVITNLLYEIVAPEHVAEWRRRYAQDAEFRQRHGETPDLRGQCGEVLKAYSRRSQADIGREREGLRLLWALQE